MSKLEQKAWQLLGEIPDPELNISLVDLGLIYKVKVKEGKAKVTMTLTTIGCPLFGVIQKTVEEKLSEIKEVQNVEVELTFDPPWTMDKMSEEAKLKLGLI